MPRDIDGNLGISRRDLIKKGAIAGGTLIWGWPVIETLAASPASAGSAVYTCCYCANPGNHSCTGGEKFQCATNFFPPTRAECVSLCASITGGNGRPCHYATVTYLQSERPFVCGPTGCSH